MPQTKTVFFKSPVEFRKWLLENHEQATELLVGFYKKDSGRGGITYVEALDEALCFGWIDAVRRSIDEASYQVRFTPRKARSIWSNVNVKKVEELTRLGRMQAAGLKAFAARETKRSGIYAFENAERKLDAAAEKLFKANKKAWEFFQAQAPWYRRTASWWIMSAKKEETQARRLQLLIRDSEKGLRLARNTRPAKKL
jgi:uncharacterized protein YdeI (YjbR/CyaY-like superfamily)